MNKELTPLEALKDLREVKGWNDKEFNERLDIIETALKRLDELEEEKQSFDRIIEKKLKALEIIKEKRVDVALLILCENEEEYNFQISLIDEDNENYKELTKEEYDLLKEVLL